MLRRFIACLLIVSLAGLGFTVPAQAALVATDAAVTQGERGRITSLLERADVRAQLQAYGVDAGDVKARVAALTDEEAAQLAAQLDSLPAGGSIVGAIVLVFLVLLVTDILGFTKVFPFTRSVR
ncbi:MAG: PA2779 family protein [Betaproteobacteria bacterium]